MAMTETVDTTHRQSDRILREPECQIRTGLSRTTRWRMEKENTFPKRRQLVGGTVGWLESEINEWIREIKPA